MNLATIERAERGHDGAIGMVIQWARRVFDRPTLTNKQAAILGLIAAYSAKHGYSPTMQELSDELGVSKVTMFEHIEALQRKGFITRRPREARSITITNSTT